RRSAEGSLRVWLLMGMAACSSETAAPSGACRAGQATQITLAIGAYASIDPASDGGCVTLAADGSADAAEYLLVPQSAVGTFGRSCSFQVRAGTVRAAAVVAAQTIVGGTWPAGTALVL